ncbi:hypothetical protein V7S43_017465 [Phytophthora oleae]|uniref:Uncharacterized protein n=1 Tax=Phytophthora oleae TaxID=2107226 RepID=A0ABD3ETA7_9STRA
METGAASTLVQANVNVLATGNIQHWSGRTVAKHKSPEDRHGVLLGGDRVQPPVASRVGIVRGVKPDEEEDCEDYGTAMIMLRKAKANSSQNNRKSEKDVKPTKRSRIVEMMNPFTRT